MGSKDNIGHRPGGGNVQVASANCERVYAFIWQIYDEKLEYIAQSKLGSGGESEKSF